MPQTPKSSSIRKNAKQGERIRFGAFGFSSVPLPSAALARWAVGTGPCFAPGLGPALAVLSKQWLSQYCLVALAVAKGVALE